MPSRIKDIAQDAGVSTATVSRVLNKTQSVSEELQARVEASVAKLGYRPNIVARSLRLRRTFVIGMIIPNVSNAYFMDIVRAAEDVAIESGYAGTICSSDQDLTKERRYVEMLRDRMVDGALIAVADRQASDLSSLVRAKVPIVLIDRRLDDAALDSVTVDTRSGAYSGVQHLVQRGYKRIATIAGPQSVSTGADKLEGYREALRDAGLPIDEELICIGDYSDASGYELGRGLLNISHPPQAVLAANNLMTLGLLRAVQERGLRIPHDIGIIGFDDNKWASLLSPPVTFVDQPTYELGKTATELLLARMKGERRPSVEHVVLRTRLIVRGSC